MGGIVWVVLRAGLFAAFILLAIAVPWGAAQTRPIVPEPHRTTVATNGDEACNACHAQGLSYVHTAHRATSALATVPALEPLFRAAGAKLTITGEPLPSLAFLMETKDGRSTQTAVTGWGNETVRTSEPIDIIVGSGRRGQSFLYWSGNQLFELPVSYWKSGHRWINSPGYVDGTADFKRPVQPGCLECHATAIVPLSSDLATNSYVRDSFVPGIACRTCHGPGEEHIALEKAAAGAKVANPAILNPANFSRDRQIDLCAVCHSGIQRTELKPAFSYRPGEPLAQYFEPLPGSDQERPDVHGNQVGLLKRSRCFAASKTMTCSTCHDVHTTQRVFEVYAAKCLTCHQWQSCGEAHRIGPGIKDKCIGCHMPVQQTNVIVSTTAGERLPASMRTHWIKVYGKDAESAP